MTVLAAAESVPDVSALAQYGPGGACALVFATACIYLFKALMKTLDLERARGDRLEAENRKLNEAIHERYVPAATSMLAEATRLAALNAETTRVLQERRSGDR